MTTLAGGGSAGGVLSGFADGTGSAVMFHFPVGIAISSSGMLYVADSSNHLIRLVTTTGTITALTNNVTTKQNINHIYCFFNRECPHFGWRGECWWCGFRLQ